VKIPLLFKIRTIVALFGLSIAFGAQGYASSAVAADGSLTVQETVEYSDFSDDYSARDATPQKAIAIAHFGPFAVIDAQTVDMSGMIDSSTPHAFKRMLTAFPGIRTIRMIECPGSIDDDANLALSRLVRRAGINTHVPANGSIRSGAVEFFLAGVQRSAETGAEFGVHSWIDDDGREATEYAASDPVHATYVNYYVDMGMKPDVARAFYNFTNQIAPHDGVYYMKPRELAAFSIVN
jgi:hypothetical protein